MFLVYLFVLAQLLHVSESFILSTDDSDRNIVSRIFVANGGQWGDWKKPTFCPNGTYAKGFELKVEYPQYNDDDTALNGIRLYCYPRISTDTTTATIPHTTRYNYITGDPNIGYRQEIIWSGEGPWGYYNYQPTTCNDRDGFLTAFKLKVESNQNFGDDTAANDIDFKCRDFNKGNGSEIASYSYTQWGDWGTYSMNCPDNSAICGLSTKIESEQNIGAIDNDDTALNDVIFYCCS